MNADELNAESSLDLGCCEPHYRCPSQPRSFKEGQTKAADTWRGAIVAVEVGEACYAVLV